MNKDNRQNQFVSAAEAPGTLEALVSQALSEVAQAQRDYGDEAPLLHPVTAALTQSVLSEEPEDRTKFVAELLGAGVTPDEFIGNYAAESARHLGNLWAQNTISFVDVTIGTARLQEAVRKLTRRHPALSGSKKRPEVLLAVPQEENHVFGLMVVATKFEALGCQVRLAVGQTPAEIAEIARAQSFGMIGISVAHTRNVRSAKAIVTALRRLPRATPIVLGGSLTESNDDLKATIGVDHVTSDAKNALRLCRIELISQEDAREKTSKMDETSTMGDVL